MNILITDRANLANTIGVGPGKSAVHFVSWKTNNTVAAGVQLDEDCNAFPGSQVSKSSAYGIKRGSCSFNTGSLFCFFGTKNASSDNVLMVLWDFPMFPGACASGTGVLNQPPASGALSGGDISWQIIA